LFLSFPSREKKENEENLFCVIMAIIRL